MVDLKGIEPSNLTDANRALSQLSYRPKYFFSPLRSRLRLGAFPGGPPVFVPRDHAFPGTRPCPDSSILFTTLPGKLQGEFINFLSRDLRKHGIRDCGKPAATEDRTAPSIRPLKSASREGAHWRSRERAQKLPDETPRNSREIHTPWAGGRRGAGRFPPAHKNSAPPGTLGPRRGFPYTVRSSAR